MKRFISLIALMLLLLSVMGVHAQDKVTLILGSWRTEDADGYANMIAMFQASHPNIEVKFEPTLNTEYDAQLRTALDGGAGPDLITCRPFDRALLLYQAGYLTDVTKMSGMEHYSDVAKSAWSTDDKSVTYCVPMASVLHGFIYNKDIFAQVGVEPPRTESEFFAVLDKIKAAGITPLGITTKDTWTTATMGFENLWPNFAGGEPERQAIIAGTAKFTDKGFVDVLTTLSKWGPYLPAGHESLGYADAQQLFPLGQAAIYPSGSWEIQGFESLADFEMGAFPPYQPDGADPKDCWLSDEVDIAMTANAKSAHPDEAKAFLEWLTTEEFAQAFPANVPGFFPLADYKIDIKDPLAAEFVSWRQDCKSTIRIADQFLNRGDPGMVTLSWDNVTAVVQGKLTPEEGAKAIQDGLDKWYKPPTS